MLRIISKAMSGNAQSQRLFTAPTIAFGSFPGAQGLLLCWEILLGYLIEFIRLPSAFVISFAKARAAVGRVTRPH